jgi:hypothetical protein
MFIIYIMNIIKMDLAIASALKRIDFQPMAQHREALFQFLKYELYDVQPQYLWTPFCPRMPKYFSFVLKEIRKLE